MDKAEIEAVLQRHKAWLQQAGGQRAYLRDVDWAGADLRGADLSRAKLGQANLLGADLREADLSHAFLVGACLHGANLAGAVLDRADLSEADVTHADLSGAHLAFTGLRFADLSHANLRGALLEGANWRGADLEGTGCIFLRIGKLSLLITPDAIAAGCQHYPHAYWRDVTKEQLLEAIHMNEEGAAEVLAELRITGDIWDLWDIWWRHWSPAVFALADVCAWTGWPRAAESTGGARSG